MALPFFYLFSYEPGTTEIALDEDNSRHIVQVLRMQRGESLQLTDGRGNLLTALIADPHKKKCLVQVQTAVFRPARNPPVYIGISLVKNASRFEWFLEKSTEIGVTGILPLLCERTERQHFRLDRMQHILVSAMLQSQQTWLPVLHNPAPFAQVAGDTGYDQRLIAHCLDEEGGEDSRTTNGKTFLTAAIRCSSPAPSRIILIGPEGDFTKNEIEMALENTWTPVSLGTNRLRTETAGIVAATLLCIGEFR